jgi:hypothetical protein
MYDGMDASEVFGDVVHGYVLNQNGLKFISVRSKDLPDKSDFSTTCCPKRNLSGSTKYIASKKVSVPSNSVAFF